MVHRSLVNKTLKEGAQMSYERQTCLSVWEIEELLEDEASAYPHCLLINELGVIAMDGKDYHEGLRVRELLAHVLATRVDDNVLYPAYGWACNIVSHSPRAGAYLLSVVTAFEQDPEHADIVAGVRAHIAARDSAQSLIN